MSTAQSESTLTARARAVVSQLEQEAAAIGGKDPWSQVHFLKRNLETIHERLDAARLVMSRPLDDGEGIDSDDLAMIDTIAYGAIELLDALEPVLKWLTAEQKVAFCKEAVAGSAELDRKEAAAAGGEQAKPR